MNRVVFTLLVICTAAITGCQDDSDYTIGSYDVITTVKSSSCPENTSEFPDDLILPTGFFAGQIRTTRWILRRVGITGNGTHQIHLILRSDDASDKELVLSGSMENKFIRIEEQQNILAPPLELYRFILIYGLIDNDNFIGEIRTLLSDARNSTLASPFIPPSSPCEIHEEFTGRQYDDS